MPLAWSDLDLHPPTRSADHWQSPGVHCCIRGPALLSQSVHLLDRPQDIS